MFGLSVVWILQEADTTDTDISVLSMGNTDPIPIFVNKHSASNHRLLGTAMKCGFILIR